MPPGGGRAEMVPDPFILDGVFMAVKWYRHFVVAVALLFLVVVADG